MAEEPSFEPVSTDGLFRVLSLDGCGAKGFYTLGVLREIEGMLGCALHERFDLIFGTSTGAIIAALLALGRRIDDIHAQYRDHVPNIMRVKRAGARSQALAASAGKVFADARFDAVKTGLGIVTTKWVVERPMIFKGSAAQAHGRTGTFSPGFGCTIADAVQASCSAYPFFERKTVTTDRGDEIELIDGGYCANNPTLYAIADAVMALHVPQDRVRVVNVGVGEYPESKLPLLSIERWYRYIPGVELIQKTFEINTQSMEQLRMILFGGIKTVRISDAFTEPEMATDLFEHNLKKLNLLHQRGSESFAAREGTLREFLI